MSAILVVDDDASFRAMMRDILEQDRHRVVEAASGDAALELLRRARVDLVIADQRMPGRSGLDLLRELRSRPGSPPVILMTGYGTIPEAVEAVRLGAADYLTKPFESPAAVLEVVARALDVAPDDAIVATTRAMNEVIETADRVAPRDVPVLIEGESGTGKELLARRIHVRSARAQQAFVAVNCAAMPETLAESELFGHERGAFTGADRAREGRFEEAHRGTLFLDEIGELPPAIQAKLLRALEERVIRRLGASRDMPVDVRVVAATNRDLGDAVEHGAFRRDLFFRLAVVSLRIPPLGERIDDIEPLARHLAAHLSRRHRLPEPVIERDAVDRLVQREWPGNVRELRNVLERAIVMRGGAPIRAVDLDPQSDSPTLLHRAEAASDKETIMDALRRSSGNREDAARLLGVSVRTLYYRLRRLGLN
ncbi:MAG TPA: sigma-54 dependent transcriptional regulator [Thermoanaerobaculia bacterium]|nr:sigma-54 dependent transcriptional regulator [Thermoanaerobaculia bacterium]